MVFKKKSFLIRIILHRPPIIFEIFGERPAINSCIKLYNYIYFIHNEDIPIVNKTNFFLNCGGIPTV